MNKLINTFNYFRYYIKYYGKFMFLHKPLCEKFRKYSFFMFGKFYICRSCLFLYIGVLLSFLISFYIKSVDIKYFILYIILILFVSYPVFYRKLSRYIRDFIRLNNGFMIGGTLIISYKYNLICFFASLILLLTIKHYYNKIRNKNDICRGCEELKSDKTCSGYLLQKQALLDLEENYCKILKIEEGDLR